MAASVQHDSPVDRPRVALIDDATQSRATFQFAYPDLELVEAFPTVEAFLDAPPRVDLVVLDLMLSTSLTGPPVMQGPAAITRLRTLGYTVCLYTDERRVLVLAQCLAAGATGIARKSDSLAEDREVFRRVAAGHTVVPNSLDGLAELLHRRGKLPDLTPRQRQVLSGRARGEPWKLLARRLGITPKTGYDRMEAVMRKMVLHLQHAQLGMHYSAADIERALGLTPGDLLDE